MADYPPVYEYKTAAIPSNLVTKDAGQAAAAALQSVINAEARGGWEFYRVDTFSTTLPAGCLSPGGAGTTTLYNVATFRRVIQVRRGEE
ncbi:MAG TPA: hypothetical protein VF576_04190 [Rubricoccaceae bacterium]